MPRKKKEPSLKYNAGKVQMDLIPPYALEMLAMVYTWGTNKYARHNWAKGLAWSSIIAAAKRHLNKFEKGIDFDEESGLPHVMHTAWQCITLYEYMRAHKKLDDRYAWVKGHIMDEKQYKKGPTLFKKRRKK